jgi:glutathione synthase/RimK-type ligase-like ATP-grasp enzyme
MTVLLWGLPGDDPLAVVRRELNRLGAPVLLLDQRDVLRTSVYLRADPAVHGWVTVGAVAVDLDAVGAAYLRPHAATQVAERLGFPAGTPEHAHAAAVDAALAAWADATPAYVVNRPYASASNGSKPGQLRAIAAAGFAVPETLVTNDPDAAREFVTGPGEFVVKSVSSVRSMVRRVRPADLTRIGDVATCPTQFQRLVPGVDVRAHVVGADVFATEVGSAADDYRYAAQQGHPPATRTPARLPDDVAERCLAVAAALGLSVAGIDLRRTPDGEWFCFEVNPSPAFPYFDVAPGRPIGRAVAALLWAAALTRGTARTVAVRAEVPAR